MMPLCKREAASVAAGFAFMAFTLVTAGAARAAFVTIDAPGSTSPGSTIEFSITLTSEGDQVASLATDIGFGPFSVDAVSGSPACALNPAVVKPQSGFRFRPSGCTPGTTCNEIRAGITSLEAATSKAPIPDGSVFTCAMTVPGDAGGTTIDLTVVKATATDPNNVDSDITAESQGAEVVVAEPSAYVTIGSVSGAPGQTVQVPVSLTNIAGSEVASLALDFGFPANSPVDAVSGSPACALNPAVVKPQSGFRFRPSGCTPGTTCNEIRAGITSLEAATSKAPIPDGVVFSCALTIPAGQALGTSIPLVVVKATATDPDNADSDITANSQDGQVSVEVVQDTPTPTEPAATSTPTMGGATETPTEPAATPTATPTGLPSDAMLIKVGRAVGVQGQTVPVDVRLFAGSALQVAGTQNDTGFGEGAEIASNASNRPMCRVNPDINKGGTSFAFQPPSCTPGDTCTGMRSFVLALDNVDAIPSGSVLYTCDVNIAEGANDAFPLTCSNPGGSTPTGGAIASGCEDGCVDVPELVAQTVGSGGTVSTGDSTTELDPTNTTITAPNAGLVSILEEGRCPGSAGPPSGFEFVGLKVTVRAPTGSPAAPVEMDFLVDSSQLEDGDELVVLHDGEPVDDCLEEGVADPEPCVESVDGGDVTVLAANARGVWEFAVALPIPTETPTEVPTATSIPSENTPTPTQPGVNTPTRTSGGGGANDEDDGCQVVAPHDSNLAWLLLMPAAMLLWRRRLR